MTTDTEPRISRLDVLRSRKASPTPKHPPPAGASTEEALNFFHSSTACTHAQKEMHAAYGST